MTVYVYGDPETKELVTVASSPLSDMESFVEIQIEDDHPLIKDPEGLTRYVLNADNAVIEEVKYTPEDKRVDRESRRKQLDIVWATVLTFLYKSMTSTLSDSEILVLWQKFNYLETNERAEYIETGYQKLLTDISGDIPGHNEWLDLDFGGITVREYIIAKLS